MLKNLFFISLCVFFSFSVEGQRRNFVHYSTENGLPTDALYNALQDSSGAILINSESGLIRFNGLDFKLFTTKDGLPGNDIIIGVLDNRGRVWLRAFGNKVCYYKEGKIYNSSNDSLVNELHKRLMTNNTVFSADENGDMAIFDYEFNSKGKRAALFLKGDTIITIANSREETPYGIEHKSNRFYSFQNGYIKVFDTNSTVDSFRSPIAFIHQMRWLNGKIYGFNEGGGKSSIVKFNLDKGLSAFKQLNSKYENERANYLWFYKKDKILYARNNKIYLTDTTLLTEELFDEFPAHVTIRGLLVDRNENLWVSTMSDGLYLLSAGALSSCDILSNRNIDDVEMVNDNIYFISGTDVFSMNLKTRKEKFLTKNSDNVSNTVFGVSDKHLVTPHLGGKLQMYKLGNGGAFDRQVVNFAGGAVKDVYCTDKFVAIAVSNGGYLIDNSGRRYTLIDKRVICIEYNKGEDALLLGTQSGLFKYSISGKRRIASKVCKEVNGHVNSIMYGPDGLLWILSNDKIYCYKKEKLFHIIKSFGYLKDYSLNCIRPDKAGQIYIGTNKGLVVIGYNIGENSLTDITEDIINSGSGLADNFVKDVEVYTDKELLVVTNTGLNVLDLSELIRWKNVRTEIFELRVNGANKSVGKTVILNHKEQFVRLRFSSLLFGRVSKLYKFRLVCLKSKWEVSPINEIEFGPLDPGEYTFEVVAVNEKYEPIGPIAKLNICIKPAFWQTLLFKVLLVLLLLGLASWVIYASVKRKQNSLLNERSFAELKMHALKAQMNPHFIFNSLNAIQSYVNQGDIKESNRYISKFSKLVRQTLNFAARDYITLQEEIEYLGNYVSLEKLRFGNKFFYILDVDEELDTDNILIPPMLIQIYAENAVRHGLTHLIDKGKLEISFQKKNDYLLCIIDDNGVGRKYSAEVKSTSSSMRQSKGMNLNLDRLDMYNVILDNKISLDIVDKTDGENALGTTVILKIPTI